MYLNSNCATCSKTMIIFEGGSHWVGVWGGVSIFKSIGTYILISTSKNRQIVKYLEHRQTTANKEIFLNIPPIPIRPKSFSFMLKKNANTQKFEEKNIGEGTPFPSSLSTANFTKGSFLAPQKKYVFKFWKLHKPFVRDVILILSNLSSLPSLNSVIVLQNVQKLKYSQPLSLF